MAGPGRHRRELHELLDEQLDFLRTSAQQFDSGVLHEYKRIALVLRVLLQDTSTSHSLLSQLGVKDMLRFVDTRREPPTPPGAIVLTAHDWPSGMVVVRATLGQVPDAGDDPATRFVPMLDRDPDRPTTNRPFDPWWRDPIFEPKPGHAFCRWDFVNGIAHKEGGAHVDPMPALSWVVLRDQQWDAVTSAVNAQGQSVPIRYLVPAVVRQIGYEVARTLEEQRAVFDPA
jgi:hypothetical protein